jgi:hypothetical protein
MPGLTKEEGASMTGERGMKGLFGNKSILQTSGKEGEVSAFTSYCSPHVAF